MGEDFRSTRPIYQQIIDRICRQIVSGAIRSGDKLPSVRELAIDLGVNPNTIQRVYQEMERSQIAVSRRGQGTFVTEDKMRLDAMRDELREERVNDFVRDMLEMGFSADEIIAGVSRHFGNEGDNA
jgi:GntR family transcriptional regulator